MKFRTASALVPVLLALCAVAVPARAASPRGWLDQSFGHFGIASVPAPEGDSPIEGFTVGADGRVYVLDGSSLLALESDGRVADDFGENGQVTVAPDTGEGAPSALAVDSQGRLLVAGSIEGPLVRHYFPAYTAYVIRILPDGSPDPGFGEGGEVDTDFGLPAAGAKSRGSTLATSIVIDAGDRPLIGGSFGKATDPCELTIGGGPNPFVARLTASGGIDRTFGKAGHDVLGGKGTIMSLARMPTGGLAVFSRPCATPPRVETRPPLFTGLTASGKATSLATERPLPFTYMAPEIDRQGRIVELESPPPVAEGRDALRRFLPNGDPDRSFGHRGRVVLKEWASAFALDAEGRPIVASAAGIRRFLPNGKLDRGFGPGGRLTAKVGPPTAIVLDAEGRIYTVSLVRNRSQTIVKVARFIPGG